MLTTEREVERFLNEYKRSRVIIEATIRAILNRALEFEHKFQKPFYEFSIEEIIEMCKIDEMLIPTIDFGHINARTLGGLKDTEDFENIIKYMINELGEERGKNFHAHFSKIEYTSGGEKKHLTFSDTEYGPEFEPLAKAIIKYNATPTIICESAGTMAEDAKAMKDIYMSLR